MSPHDLAREFVLQGLRHPVAATDGAASLQTIQETLLRLRGDLVTATEVLLVTAGKLPREAAYQWVEEHLVNACSPSPPR